MLETNDDCINPRLKFLIQTIDYFPRRTSICFYDTYLTQDQDFHGKYEDEIEFLLDNGFSIGSHTCGYYQRGSIVKEKDYHICLVRDLRRLNA